MGIEFFLSFANPTPHPLVLICHPRRQRWLWTCLIQLAQFVYRAWIFMLTEGAGCAQRLASAVERTDVVPSAISSHQAGCGLRCWKSNLGAVVPVLPAQARSSPHLLFRNKANTNTVTCSVTACIVHCYFFLNCLYNHPERRVLSQKWPSCFVFYFLSSRNSYFCFLMIIW